MSATTSCVALWTLVGSLTDARDVQNMGPSAPGIKEKYFFGLIELEIGVIECQDDIDHRNE